MADTLSNQVLAECQGIEIEHVVLVLEMAVKGRFGHAAAVDNHLYGDFVERNLAQQLVKGVENMLLGKV